VGLAAEGLPEYVTQRARWCLGTIQVALLKDGPFRNPHFSLLQRFHYLHGVLNWICKPFILLMLLAPSVYLFFDVPAFQADYVAFFRHAVPALIMFYGYSGWVSRRKTLPLFMEVTDMMTAVAVTWTLITCCYRPFGRPFKVTDKGGDRSRTIVRWGMMRVFGSLLAISLCAIGLALAGPYSVTEATPVDRLNLIWAGVSALLCGVACLVCVERPRSHREELFETHHEGHLAVEGEDFPCLVRRLSTVDASVVFDSFQPVRLGTSVQLCAAGEISLRGAVSSQRGRTITIELDISEEQRRAIMIDIYGIPNNNVPLQVETFRAIGGLFRRAFGRN
jgi:cellulose synthase (UDP-forming)